MNMNPDEVFRRMDERRAVHELPMEQVKPAREPVYIPRTTRDGTYRRLMRSHDRMGTRHLQ